MVAISAIIGVTIATHMAQSMSRSKRPMRLDPGMDSVVSASAQIKTFLIFRSQSGMSCLVLVESKVSTLGTKLILLYTWRDNLSLLSVLSFFNKCQKLYSASDVFAASASAALERSKEASSSTSSCDFSYSTLSRSLPSRSKNLWTSAAVLMMASS